MDIARESESSKTSLREGDSKNEDDDDDVARESPPFADDAVKISDRKRRNECSPSSCRFFMVTR
jgi:hypothetical protein